eukprot:1104325-Rhodomonas_salina.1
MAAESNQRAPKYTFDESYGSIGSNALARNRRVRLVAVALSMAALALVAMVWPQGQTRISAFQMGESKNWSNFEPSANAEAYIDGEKNILDLFFRESEATNTVWELSRIDTGRWWNPPVETDRSTALGETFGGGIGGALPGGSPRGAQSAARQACSTPTLNSVWRRGGTLTSCPFAGPIPDSVGDRSFG